MTGVIGRRRKSRPMTGKIGTVRPPLAVAGARAGAAIGGAGEGRQLASGRGIFHPSLTKTLP